MKRVAGILLALGLGLSTAACSGNDTGASGTDPSPSASPTAQAASNLPDPHAMTGMKEAESIGDPEVIEGNYKQSLPVTLTDEENNTVTVTDTSRVLAIDIYGTISRTVIALGYGDNLVGRTISSTEKSLEDLPVVTQNGHELNSEAVMTLNPTLIIADRSVGDPAVLDRIRATGVPVVLVSSDRSLETNSQLMTDIAHALGADEAGKALVERTEGEIKDAQEQIAQWTPQVPLDAAFLYVRGTAGIFFILGPDGGSGALIEALGARDVAGANGITGTTPANAEALVALNPEVVFVMSGGLESTGGVEGLLARAGMSDIRAGQNQRIIAIPDGMALSFGPQTGDILLSIAKALYGVES